MNILLSTSNGFHLDSDSSKLLSAQAEKESGDSPLSKFVGYLRQRSKQRNGSLVESRLIYFSNVIFL